MQFNQLFIEQLAVELQKPLPGEDAQYRMAPSYRPRLTKDEIQSKNPRQGGVMLLLYIKGGAMNIVFTQRKDYNGVHGGQMSFPGGKKDAIDNNLLATALRETKEEVGIEASQIRVIGNLSQLYIPPSNFLVLPVVGYAEHIGTFTPQKEEVEKIVEIPLTFFLDATSVNYSTKIKLFNGAIVHVPAYVYGQHIIWGATAIMLSEFTFIVESISR